MELIKPAEISGKIMTLIDDASELVVIVSPYNKFTNWTKLTKRISEALTRGVKIEWYIRANVKDNYSEVLKLGIKPIEVENLHCKIYMNETSAVVTSMNLLEYSDSNSIDIGYQIINKKDHDDLMEFVNLYIRKVKSKQKSLINTRNEKRNSSNTQKNLIEWIKVSYPEYANSIIETTNKYGNCLEISNFCSNYRLIIEQKYAYLRIDLRIGFEWNLRKRIYEELEKKRMELERQIGIDIVSGNEMKRFKIDITDLPSYNYTLWTSEEFEQFKPLFEKIVSMYTKILPSN